MSLLSSLATEAEVEEYTTGSCHHIAIALNRKLGWAVQLHLDNGEPFWEDESDPDNFIPAVLHAYAVDPQGRAWDVRGVRDMQAARTEIDNSFFPHSHDTDECRGEGELKMYVGCWGEEEDIDRPLTDYSDADIEQAWVLARRIFAGMEGFEPSPQPVPRKPSRP